MKKNANECLSVNYKFHKLNNGFHFDCERQCKSPLFSFAVESKVYKINK